MTNRLKRMCVVFIAALLFIVINVGLIDAHELQPTKEFFINDFADVIPEDIEAGILEAGLALEEETTAQIVLVTVESIGENDIFDYSLSLARDWGIGTAETSNGCLIFLSINDKKSFVQVGYGLEGCLTDGKTGKLQDDFLLPYMVNKEYGLGALNIYNAIAEEVYKEYSMEAPVGVKAEKRPMDLPTKIFLGGLYTLGAAFAAFFIWVVFKGVTSKESPSIDDNDRNRSGRNSGSSSGGGSSGGNSGGGGSFGGGGSGRSW